MYNQRNKDGTGAGSQELEFWYTVVERRCCLLSFLLGTWLHFILLLFIISWYNFYLLLCFALRIWVLLVLLVEDCWGLGVWELRVFDEIWFLAVFVSLAVLLLEVELIFFGTHVSL